MQFKHIEIVKIISGHPRPEGGISFGQTLEEGNFLQGGGGG